jgi:hypothetical protein
MKFSKKIVILVIALNALFALAVLWVFFKVSSEPVVLIGAWFGFTTTELWALAGIKKGEKNE